MKFEEKSYIDRCLDVVVGRDGKNFTFFIRVPSYRDLPNAERREEHRQEVLDFIRSVFPECQEMYFFKGTSMLKAVCSSEDIYSRFPDFPKESEDDSLFRKEAELYLKKKMGEKSARIYSENAALWDAANLVSVKVFPKFPYPLKADLSVVEDKDVVTVSFPWLAYRFYAPIFEKAASLLIKSFGAKIVEEPPVTQMTSSAWTKRLAVEGKNAGYVANLVKQGLERLGVPLRFQGTEMPVKDSHVDKFVKIVTAEEVKKEQKKQREIKDRIVPYVDRPLLYVQLFPETLEKVKDKIEQFVKEKGLKGGQFVPARGYVKSYIGGDARTMAGFENRVVLAKELALRTGVEAEIPEPVVGIYETKVSGGNTRVCVRIPKPWDRSVDKSKADEGSKKLDSAIREFQANDWESVFPGTYVFTYSLLIPKGSPDEEIAKAREEAVNIVSNAGLQYDFVNMKERRAQKAEREIQKNIANISEMER